VYDSRSDVFRFAHKPVQDFVYKSAAVPASEAHRILASKCLRICKAGFASPVTPYQTLQEYVSIYWPCHYRLAGPDVSQGVLLEEMLNLVFGGRDYVTWAFESWLGHAKALCDDSINFYRPWASNLNTIQGCNDSNPTALFAACVYGLHGVLDYMEAQDTVDWNERNAHGHTGLYLAAYSGFDEIVAALVQRGASLDIACGNKGHAFAVACYHVISRSSAYCWMQAFLPRLEEGIRAPLRLLVVAAKNISRCIYSRVPSSLWIRSAMARPCLLPRRLDYELSLSGSISPRF
jgi:hypothetical protein